CMLSPVSHAADAERARRYKTEPYVVAADVYGVAPHVGRGGWTWYTGSSGWMYRVALESILGVRLEPSRTLGGKACIPHDSPGVRRAGGEALSPGRLAGLLHELAGPDFGRHARGDRGPQSTSLQRGRRGRDVRRLAGPRRGRRGARDAARPGRRARPGADARARTRSPDGPPGRAVGDRWRTSRMWPARPVCRWPRCRVWSTTAAG